MRAPVLLEIHELQCYFRSALSVAEQRFANVPEFQAMLGECQQAYFNTRQQLLSPIIQATLAHMFR